MNLVKFIENRYQELTFEVQKTEQTGFEVVKDAEIKAAHQILTTYRFVLKWFLIPKVLFNFIQVKLHLKKEPEPVILNQMKRDQEAQKVAKELLKKASNVSDIHPQTPESDNRPAG